MKRIVVVLTAWIAFTACRYQPQQHGEDSIAIPKKSFSAADSLEKYLGTDSLFVSPSHKYYVGKLNGVDYAFVQNTDSTTLQYQRVDEKWRQQDSFPVPLYLIQIADLNGDKLKDLILTYNVTGAGGNAENISLLYYSAQKHFVHNPFFDLPNISYDSSTRFIHSSWYGGMMYLQQKMLYRMDGDSLVWIKEVEYEPDEKAPGRLATISFYTIRNNEPILEKEQKGESEKLFEVFLNALWDTHNEF